MNRFSSIIKTIAISSCISLMSLSAYAGYVFEPEDLNQIGKQAASEVDEYFATLPQLVLKELAISYFKSGSAENEDLIGAFRAETLLDRVYVLLKEKYLDKILDKPVWAWNNVGGIYARIMVLYCSFGEYVALFGSNLKQQGFSGEYSFMDVYDIMVSGEMVSHDASSEGALPITYRGGDVSLLKKNETRLYNMDKFTYMIDYGRGQIAQALWQGVIAPRIFVNHDNHSMKEQLKSCARSFVNGAFGR